MDAIKDKNALDNYFLLLKSILDDNDLKDKPGQIHNMDDLGVSLVCWPEGARRKLGIAPQNH